MRGLIARVADEAKAEADRKPLGSQFASVMPIRQKAG